MSEISETYNLRVTDQQSGAALLVAAGLRGFVYPPENGWATLLVEGWQGQVPPSLIAHNKGILVRYLFAEDFGWQFSIWSGAKRIAHYECEWEGETLTVRDEALSLSTIASLVLPRPDDPQMLQALRDILHPRRDDYRLPRPPVRFLELTGLPNSQWSSYDYLLDNYDEADPEFAGIRHIDATVPAQNQAQRVVPYVSERLRKALVFPSNLRGDDAAVRRCWSKIIRKAWKAGTWAEVISELEFVSVVDEMPFIISRSDSYERPRGSEYWRPYWIGVLLDQIACKVKEEYPKVCEPFDRLAFEGMQHFWFALGILETDEMFFPPLSRVPNASRTPEQRNRDYLEKFLPWLNELCELRRLMWNAPYLPIKYLLVESPKSRSQPCPEVVELPDLSWARNLLGLCYRSGVAKPDAETAALNATTFSLKHRGDVISMILDLNLVRREGDEYVLNFPEI